MNGDDAEVSYYSPWMFLRAMFLVAWSALRHPFLYTQINQETGEMRHYASDDEIYDNNRKDESP
jgi:hypothetical protein